MSMTIEAQLAAVTNFAELMKVRLESVSSFPGKQGWDGDSPKVLFDRMLKHIDSLESSMFDGNAYGLDPVDIANYCMMILSKQVI